MKTLTSQQPCDSVAVPSQPLIQNGDELLIMLLCRWSLWIACLEINVALYNLYATVLHRRRNTVCSALLSNGPQQTLRRYRVRPYLERRYWTRPGRTSAWWDNFVHEVVILEEWLENFRMSRRSLLNLSELLRSGAEAAFQCGQRDSLKTIIRFRDKSCVFKFIPLSVDVA